MAEVGRESLQQAFVYMWSTRFSPLHHLSLREDFNNLSQDVANLPSQVICVGT
jgi:hypothetical protein